MSLLYPVAAVINGGDPDPRPAWKQAVLREKRLCGSKACRAASKLLCRYFAFNFSTSGVERLSLALNLKSIGLWFSDTLLQTSFSGHNLGKVYFNLSLNEVRSEYMDVWNTKSWCQHCSFGGWASGELPWACWWEHSIEHGPTWMGYLASVNHKRSHHIIILITMIKSQPQK